jgi:hypothetical protein
MQVLNRGGFKVLGSHGLELAPGLNEVSEKNFSEAAEHTGCKRLLESGELEVLQQEKNDAEDEQPPQA